MCVSVCTQPPGKRVAGLSVQAKLDVYLWFGACKDSSHMLDNLPAGFTPATGGADANSPPTHLHCEGETEANFCSVYLPCFIYCAFAVYRLSISFDHYLEPEISPYWQDSFLRYDM